MYFFNKNYKNFFSWCIHARCKLDLDQQQQNKLQQMWLNSQIFIKISHNTWKREFKAPTGSLKTFPKCTWSQSPCVRVNKKKDCERRKRERKMLKQKQELEESWKKILNKFLRSPIDSSQFFAILRGVQVVRWQEDENKIKIYFKNKFR